MKIYKIFNGMALAAAGVAFGLSSCSEDIDESNLYTFTGETVESIIEADSTLTNFNYVLERANLKGMMESYGQYTCFAPSNEGIEQYIDSLYNDPEAVVEHNSMTENSIYGLTDSLCNDIARYHLANGVRNIMDIEGQTISTMLGRPISTAVDSLGQTVLNSVATIISGDNEAENGVVHKIDKVVPRSTRYIGDTFDRIDGYTIFTEALNRTGLVDSIAKADKGITYTITDHTDTGGEELYWPEECKLGYTIFAESDAVLAANGINSFDDLVDYANQVYAGAAEWYDYLGEKGLSVNTGTTDADFVQRNNALNMFVAYHILYCSMAQDQLVFERKDGVAESTSKWNYVNGGEPYDYYETMLPHTLMKIWQPNPRGDKKLYINRYETFNTLTNEVASVGTMHEVRFAGVEIERTDIMAYNGYIHPITSMLVYDSQVPNGVLHERLRFEATTFLPEFINNGIRYLSMSECSALNGGGSGARVAFPLNYFDNVVSYTDENQFRYNIKGDFRAYQADAFQGWGTYDLAVKLPPVPTGTYEFRLFYSPMDHGGMMQFYLGTSTNVQEMTALDIPLDVRIPAADPRIGWTAFYEEDDLGIATDEAMRNRGYMRAPVSFRGHPDGTGDMQTNNCRGDGVVTLRRILGREQFRQSDDHWFRIKSVINDDTDLKWQIDFIELVPVDVVDNDQYSEDWW